MLARIARRGADGVWIALAPRDRLLDDARALGAAARRGRARCRSTACRSRSRTTSTSPGLPTTAACPAFAYRPEAHAPVVARLIAAGALVVGKTNLDQFATGLVGVRSPYGDPAQPVRRSLHRRRLQLGLGGRVAAGLVSFALGTDTAGSGRVPAAFNNIVGLKPSRGLLSTTGVVPACRSLDCVSVFALDGRGRGAPSPSVARGYDPDDPGVAPGGRRVSLRGRRRGRRGFASACPAGAALDFLGDARAAELFERAVGRLEALGGERVEHRLRAVPRRRAACSTTAPFVAERLEAAGADCWPRIPTAIVAPVRTILEGATRFDARAAFAAQHRLTRLRRRAGALLAGVDFLFVPTTPTIYTIDEVEAEPLRAQRAARAPTRTS